jgi:protein TonB
VIRLGPGIEKPTLVSKAPLTWTREAFEHNIGGIALVRCIIELDGSVSHCRMRKRLPNMDEAILSSVSKWRYTPVLFKGRPQRVEIIIPIRIPRPRGVPPRGQGDAGVDTAP